MPGLTGSGVWIASWLADGDQLGHSPVFLLSGRTERDATIWSKGKLRELLVGIAVENEAGRCEISELKQVEGEASCSSRKGKLIFFYEWNIRLAWKGKGVLVRGKLGTPSGIVFPLVGSSSKS